MASSEVIKTTVTTDSQMPIQEFSSHVDEANSKFKDSICDKVVMIQTHEKTILRRRVDLLKEDEKNELDRLNRIFAEEEEQGA